MGKPESPINLSDLLEIMDNDDELLRECMDDFLNDFSEMLNQIRSAVDSCNWEDLEVTAHAMKGSLRYLAAGAAADFALKLENIGKSGGTVGAEGINEHFTDLENECEQMRLFIRNYLA
ncbi:MAG: Hpt domain-containing protein [Desulfobacteraceae bacterium]|jgi:HPt (histidine-containing phosphotransfer) domain-containing protein